ncbi:MAG: hypothetical protein AAGJ52_06735 [Pseudomonadota bacterium]
MKWLIKTGLVLVLTLGIAVSAWAVTLREAADRVARQYDAKVVSAQTVERNGRRVHVIRILTREGVVRTVRVPAD